MGCSPWGRKESDTTEQLPFHFSLSCIGEGNGNPLQCSCLENPRDRAAWWAAVYGVTQSRTRLKLLSSSSSRLSFYSITIPNSFPNRGFCISCSFCLLGLSRSLLGWLASPVIQVSAEISCHSLGEGTLIILLSSVFLYNRTLHSFHYYLVYSLYI